MSNEFDLNVRVSRPAASAGPAGTATFATTCWSCGDTCADSCGGTCGEATCQGGCTMASNCM
jgi:hypothetical protein